MKQFLEQALYDLRCRGCQDERFDFIATVFENAAKDFGVAINRNWGPNNSIPR